MAKAEEGIKVHVIITDDLSESQLQGTITKVEQLIVEETNEVLSEHFPTITLDDGRIVNGMECWWYPVDKEKRDSSMWKSK